MIDTHAHLQDEKFEDVDEVINRAKSEGITNIICASSSIKTSKDAVKIAERYSDIYAVVGIHPEEAGEWGILAKQEIKKLAKSKKVVAIGEIGLDYHYEFFSRDVQKNAFIDQIELANELNLPVVIHTRDASGDTMEIIRDNLKYLKNKTIIHCYSMSEEILKEIIGYGFYISLGGAITFKNARSLLDIVRACPIDRLLLETDCPYMSPEPFRGKINEPKNVYYVAKKIAELKNLSLDEVINITTKNAIKIFNLE